jgi:hypothetical protein
MSFDYRTLPNRNKARVVARLLLEGRGDGGETVAGPMALDVTLEGGNANCCHRLRDGRYFETGAYQDVLRERGKPDLIVGDDGRNAPNWVEGTGKVTGIAILGLVGKREDDVDAVEHLSRDAPSIVGRWADYVQGRLEASRATEATLEDGARDGFGLGMPIRFAR